MNHMATIDNLASSASTKFSSGSLSVIHPSCVIDPSVQLGEKVTIHANVVIERGVWIGNGTVIYPGCYVGEDCFIGDNTILYQSVVLREKTKVGSGVIIEAGVVIGSDGFGYAKEANGINCKVPQVGFVVIDDFVRIGANTTIDRATLGKTHIGKRVEIGSLVQVGHNVDIGENSFVGDNVGICGSCKIGTAVQVGHGAGMVGHIHIGDGAQVKNGSGVSKDVQNEEIIMGSPGMTEDQYNYFQQFLVQLPEFVNRLNELEKRLAGSE